MDPVLLTLFRVRQLTLNQAITTANHLENRLGRDPTHPILHLPDAFSHAVCIFKIIELIAGCEFHP